MKKLLNEFKEFISKGNVIDMAVGVVIGSAFSKIVTSLVNDIIMPLVGIIIGGLDFTSLSIKIKDSEILYGSFIQNIVDFLIIAACIFTVIKIMNKFKKQKPVEEPKPVETPEDIKLLTEIRDLLKKENKKK
jgi:large conductance mechanosensitive channel